MSNIKVMSDNLANKIAAGEVVERIASVVKELVENSIDAKSKEIIVSLVDSGTKEIKILDDGIGMDRNDAELCFSRHATSKLLKEDDLFFISTLGFRGEALPSIASIAKVDLVTSTGDVGTHIEIHGGNTIIVENSDARRGTCISVKDLFYNTPARLKFLKSDNTELANVTMLLEKLALTRPDISFSLYNNDRRILFTSGSGELLKTIYELYGYETSSNMLEIKASSDDADIYGYICKPSVLKSNRNQMITIVNNRVVKNNDLNRAINEGYFTFKPDIKYPVVVIKIDIDPTLIDVNVHPTKQDIKISKINELNILLTNTINDALKKSLLVPEVNVNKYVAEEDDVNLFNSVVNEPVTNYENVNIIQDQLDFKTTFNDVEKKVIEETHAEAYKNELVKKLELYRQGVVFGTYIVAQNDEGMFLIDQHAAQERINYEKILNAFKNNVIETTTLLIPMTFEFSTSEFMKLKENIGLINELGFKLEEFGINTYNVVEHPTWLRDSIEYDQTKEIFDIIIEGKYLFDRLKFNDHIAATMACKMSVKGNEAITLSQAEKLLADLVLCENPYNCPHGRPTIIKFTKYELERMFKRVMN